MSPSCPVCEQALKLLAASTAIAPRTWYRMLLILPPDEFAVEIDEVRSARHAHFGSGHYETQGVFTELILERRLQRYDFAIDRDCRMSLLDRAPRHKEAVEMWRARERANAARRGGKGERHEPGSRPASHDHHVKTPTPVVDSTPQLGKFQLALPNADED